MKKFSIETLFPPATVIIFWLISIYVWWASLWHIDLFSDVGFMPPALSDLVMKIVVMKIPFGIAAIFSVAVIYAMFRHSHRVLLLSAWLLFISTALLLIVLIALTLPMTKMCGQFVPGWGGGI